ncbi:MAG: hypothetical protein ACT4OF_00595 [Caulobacteraceae bacterium]
MSEQPPPRPELPRVKGRLPFDPNPFGRPLQRGAIFLYAALTLGLAGVAVYMATVVGHALTSGYVAAPAIGALWFGLRLFMMLGKR